jgi:hypothetical protein
MGLVDTEAPWVDDARQPTSTPTREHQPDADGFTVQDSIQDPTFIDHVVAASDDIDIRALFINSLWLPL